MSKVGFLQGLMARSFARPGSLVGLMITCGLACGRDAPESDPPRQLLANGSFETGPLPGQSGQFITLSAGSGEVPGWTISGGGIDYIFSMWRGADGSRSIDLSALSEGTISQPLDHLKPGVTYTVHFWLAGNIDCAPAAKRLRVEAAEQTADFTFDTTGRTALQMGWTRHGFDFTSKASSTTLTFRSLTGSRCGPALDGIELSTP